MNRRFPVPEHPKIKVEVGEVSLEYLIEEVVFAPNHPTLGGEHLMLITPEGEHLCFRGAIAGALARQYCEGNLG